MPLHAPDLRARIATSHLLTEGEKTYWSSRLPSMNEAQLTRLEGILREADSIVWTPRISDYLSIITKAQKAFA